MVKHNSRRSDPSSSATAKATKENPAHASSQWKSVGPTDAPPTAKATKENPAHASSQWKSVGPTDAPPTAKATKENPAHASSQWKSVGPTDAPPVENDHTDSGQGQQDRSRIQSTEDVQHGTVVFQALLCSRQLTERTLRAAALVISGLTNRTGSEMRLS
eukprot:TRINITY_DN18370_c0_g1_i11.p2 TRINITY_DN18370_c0_g1~~TRINITY_DN18370_c0_g1_i11.p2  ORF type:complete len:160 (+),score=36.85 TRINITY_DN18370_c0_g1_i11:1329-1808(+)